MKKIFKCEQCEGINTFKYCRCGNIMNSKNQLTEESYIPEMKTLFGCDNVAISYTGEKELNAISKKIQTTHLAIWKAPSESVMAVRIKSCSVVPVAVRISKSLGEFHTLVVDKETFEKLPK